MSKFYALCLVLIILYSSGQVQTSKASVTDLTIRIENGLGGPYFYNFSRFEETFTNEGATVEIEDTYTEPRSKVDALLLTTPTFFNGSELSEITSWFKDDTQRLLWVSGNNDYGGYYNPDVANQILSGIGSHIRVSDEEVQDPKLNDGASYRVISNQTYNNGEYNKIFTDGVTSAIFHGPAPLYVEESGIRYDPHNKQIDGVEIVMDSGPESFEVDAVESTQGYYISFNKTGNLPLMMVERIDKDHFAIVTGDAIYSDYKEMYGLETENNIWGKHQGKFLVDNVINWFGDLKDTNNTLKLSYPALFVLIPFAIIPIILKRKNS